MKTSLRWTLALGMVVTGVIAHAPDAEARRVRAKQERPRVDQTAARDQTRIDLATPEGAVLAMRRIWCTMTDNEPAYWHWRGEAWARRQGERDRMLFRVEGINVRTCIRVTDPVRGEGVRTLSRELLVYVDPQTNQPLVRWNNPFTGEAVDVVHVANDPVNGEFYPRGPEGQPMIWRGSSIGDSWFLTSTAPLFYDNPLGGEFQAEIGGAYHATEMFSFSGEVDNLTDRRRNSANVRVGWVRISDWLPWMRMNGREGLVYMHLSGCKVARWEDLSPLMQQEVAQRYPTFRTPPPPDDRRPNETSWGYYRKVREGAIKTPERAS